jgi:Fe-S-cluster containining protein
MYSRPRINLAEQRDSIGSMNCRPDCGACCTAPSISSPIPGMPRGKPAGVRCLQLDADERCRLFGQPARPAVCASLRPSLEMCGSSREQALAWIGRLERLTAASPATTAPPLP